MHCFGAWVNNHYFQTMANTKEESRQQLAHLADASGVEIPYQTKEGLKYRRPVASDAHPISCWGTLT